jgi:hypothetical protein
VLFDAVCCRYHALASGSDVSLALALTSLDESHLTGDLTAIDVDAAKLAQLLSFYLNKCADPHPSRNPSPSVHSASPFPRCCRYPQLGVVCGVYWTCDDGEGIKPGPSSELLRYFMFRFLHFSVLQLHALSGVQAPARFGRCKLTACWRRASCRGRALPAVQRRRQSQLLLISTAPAAPHQEDKGCLSMCLRRPAQSFCCGVGRVCVRALYELLGGKQRVQRGSTGASSLISVLVFHNRDVFVYQAGQTSTARVMRCAAAVRHKRQLISCGGASVASL